jgi:hypothetical protein
MNYTQQTDKTGIFLYGAITLANIDYSGLGAYAIKALVGGAIWLGFKVLSEYITDRWRKDK